MEDRLQKLIAAAGLCSRRTAETWLITGRVEVNGRRAQLGDKANPELDRITVDGKPLVGSEKMVYLLLNKPCGYVTTLSDEQGRHTVAELVADAGIRIFPVGRLDMDSEGLLLLTNDGALMQRLLHPSHKVNKTYLVTVTGNIQGAAERLSHVTDLNGETICPAQVETLSQSGGQAVLSVTIHEGKNRQIRRMCTRCELSVRRLQRIREHTLELGDLPLGKWRSLTEDEVSGLWNG